jgi:hypothetical protein
MEGEENTAGRFYVRKYRRFDLGRGQWYESRDEFKS